MSGPDRSLLEDAGRLLGPGRRALTREQDAVVRDRDGPLMVAANAGSGKTTVLVERFVRYVVDDGVDPAAILAITFTRRAAGELRRRVRMRFMELGCIDHARAVESGWISTIDGFCARVLRAHAVVAGIDPAFVVLDPGELRGLRDRAWEVAVTELLEPGPGGVPAAGAEHLVTVYGYDELGTLIGDLYDERRSAGEAQPRLPAVREPDLGALRERLRRSGEALRAELAGARTLATIDTAREKLADCLAAVGDAWVGSPPSPGLLQALRLPQGGGIPELGTAACEAYRDAYTAFAQGCVDIRAHPVVACLDAFLAAYGSAFAAAKRAVGGLDYTDLATTTRDLLESRADLAAAYRERLQRVMVDEYQDTNGLQRDLLAALGQEHLFTVGDRLQSIYAFRHADVEVFSALWREREAAGRARTLATNFRSRPEILALINAAWGMAHGAGYDALLAGRDTAGDGPRVELLLTDAGAWDALESGDAVAAAVGAALPSAPARVHAEARLVARRVAGLTGSDGAYAPGDVVVLLRSGSHMAVYERALEQAAVPAVATQGRGWWTRREVQDLLNHLRVLVNPLDEPAAFGALAAPFAGLRADALALLATARRTAGASLWEIVERAATDPAVAPELAAADRDRLRSYSELVTAERAEAAWASPGELIERVVAATGYDVDVLRRPGGTRRLANIRKLVRLAHGYERRGGRDLRGFVDFAAAELEAGEPTPDAPIDLGEDEAVRLMTVHGAKGLEFPVVVLGDLGRDLYSDTPDVIVRGGDVGLRVAMSLDEKRSPAFAHAALDAARRELEQAEERRVMHVAVTRAEELLVLSGSYDPEKGWPPEGFRRPHLSWMGRGISPAPVAGDETVIVPRDGWWAEVRTTVSTPQRAEELLGVGGGDAGAGAAQAPGAAAPTAPVSLPEPPAPPVPAPASVSYTSLTDYARCPYSWYLRRVLGLQRRDPGELAAQLPPGFGEDALRRGSIAHLVLERAALEADAPALGAADVQAAAALVDAELDDEEIADQLALAGGFLDGDLRRRASRATELRREAPFAFSLALGDPSAPLVNGVIDLLALEDGGGALVVDYKSDRIAPQDAPEELVVRDYAVQRAVYALAVLRSGRSWVDVAHLYLSRPHEPAVARLTQDDVPLLESLLAAAAEPLLDGAFPVTQEPHAALCATCPGRGGMCPWPAEMTDRPLPED